MDLTPFQWKNRLLFLFAPDDSHPDFRRLQSNIAKHQHEVEDRDLVIFEVLGQGPSRMNTVPLNQPAADSIRDRFGIVKNGFALILVGKDGGVKMRRVDAVGLADVFERIDSMPMRQNEMRLKNK